jgi:hypothetical protein
MRFAPHRFAPGPTKYPSTKFHVVGIEAGEPMTPPDIAPVRSDPVMLVAWRVVPLRFVPDKLALVKSALDRSAPDKSVPDRSTPFMFVCGMTALLKEAPKNEEP